MGEGKKAKTTVDSRAGEPVVTPGLAARGRRGASLAAVLLGALLAAPVALADEALQIKVLSNRADLVSGGDALVEVVLPASASPASLAVDVGGEDVTDAFAVRANGRLMGVVNGLSLGTNVLTASASGATAARITVTNHPIGGPVFAGYQVQPWICQTEENGFGEPFDEHCNVAPRFEYFYRSTNPARSGFTSYDPANPPADVATTTTDQGHTVPYIVRRETGVIDRGWYSIAVLWNPSEPWEIGAPQAGWNQKIVWPFGGSSAPDHYQNNPTNVLNDSQLAKGFMVAANSLNTHGQNMNDVVSSEVVMMVKEHIIENYGEVRYVIGEGCSGGSIMQHLLANAYPGIIDGIQPSCSYSDFRTNETRECSLLTRYFTETSPHLWAVEEQQAAVYGHATAGTCTAFVALFANYLDPTSGCGGNNNEPWLYDPETNPEGTRCTSEDYQVAQWGRRPEDGFARRAYSNEGLQYGLEALHSGEILPEQFVDLNEKVGGVDIDHNPVPERVVGDLEAFPIAYRTGRVNDARHLASVPIIDLRGTSNLEIHTDVNSHILRARLEKANGHHDNQIIWTFGTSIVTPPSIAQASLDLMDSWLAAIEADESDDPREEKVLRHKPDDATDACFVGSSNERIDDPDACAAAYPYFGTIRLASGGPESNDVLKCQLQPLDRADYANLPVPFTDAQWARMEAAFPTGVCDWAQPAVGEQPSDPWVTFEDGPGLGRPLGDPPVSQPVSGGGGGGGGEADDKTTGGGWLASALGGKINFGFNAKVKSDGSLKGNLNYRDKDAGVRIRLDEVTALGAVGAGCGGVPEADNALSFEGDGSFNGAAASFRVCVQDNGEGSSSAADRFHLSCTAGCSYSSDVRAADDRLDGGNIQVRRESATEPGATASSSGNGSQASGEGEASTLVLGPMLLASGVPATLQPFTVTVYDAGQAPLAGAPVTLTRTGADGEVLTLSGVTGLGGVLKLFAPVSAESADYQASAGNGARSNFVELAPLGF